LLEAFFEGVLPEEQAKAVAAHVQSCTGCAHELAQIEKVTAALAAVPLHEPSTDFVRQVSVRVAALPTPGRRSRLGLLTGWQRLEVLAAACVVVLACWRYAIPPLFAAEGAATPLMAWFKGAVLSGTAWVMAAPGALGDLVVGIQGVLGALELTAGVVAPTVALYAVTEIGIVAAVVLIGHRAHRVARATLTSLL